MNTQPYLTLHASQIQQFVDSIEIDDSPRVLVTPSPEAKSYALQECRAAGIAVPPAGAFTLPQLDAALAVAFPPADTLSLGKRIKMKATLYAGGMIAEQPDDSKKRATVVAVLHLKKAGIELPPSDKPYSLQEFDQMLAAKDSISIEHRFQIKSACLAGGLVADPPRKPAGPLPETIQAARAICDRLGLEPPTGGKKLSITVLDAAMASRGWDANRRTHSKTALVQSGCLAA
jgi:hypothetical protein